MDNSLATLQEPSTTSESTAVGLLTLWGLHMIIGAWCIMGAKISAITENLQSYQSEEGYVVTALVLADLDHLFWCILASLEQ